MQTIFAIQNIAHLTDVTEIGVFHQCGILVVGTVVGHRTACSQPWAAYVLWFAQVGQRYNVSCIGGSTGLVGHPYLYAFDIYTTGYGGQSAHILVVGIAEMVCQIEVFVFFVVSDGYLITGGIRTATARYALAGRFLLTEHRLQGKLAKLYLRVQAKQTAHAWYQTHIGWHGYVASLHQLDYLVLLTIIFQLQILSIIIKRCIRVVLQIEIHLVAHLGRNAQVYLHIKVQAKGFSATGGQSGIVRRLHIATNLQF